MLKTVLSVQIAQRHRGSTHSVQIWQRPHALLTYASWITLQLLFAQMALNHTWLLP